MDDGVNTISEDAIKGLPEWKPLVRQVLEAEEKMTIANLVDIWELPDGKTINGKKFYG
jgi:hypothetical protein